jgi:signal transduction histidine kinase/ActR/RegA family two-component response regulator
MKYKTPDSQSVRKSISRFRKLTIVSVAVIMVTNFIMVLRITSVFDHGSATKINESGRMRMLSQRVRSVAFEINSAVQNKHWELLDGLHRDLVDTTNHLTASYNELFDAQAPAEFFPDASTREIDQVSSIVIPYKRLTNSSSELQSLTQSVIRTSPYVNATTRTRIQSTTNDLRDAQTLFLPRMNTIVSLYEQHSGKEINESIRQARIGIFVLAAMLAAMVLFIIEPTILIVRRQLRELDLATKHARRADSVRWRLLTNMGHEFRTPMNAILGFSELLNDDSLSQPEQDRLARSINESASQLSTLIETMLDMSAIESGQLRITPVQTTLAEALAPCILQAQTDSITNGLDLIVELDESCNTPVITEPRRLMQIVQKLADNAFKFTQEGHIKIAARVESKPKCDIICVEVHDTGIGIAPNQHENIFDAFHQTQNNLTREFGGSGLGLSFARDLASALDGEISVASIPNKGSTFTLTIDAPKNQLSQTNEPQAQSEQAKLLANARVLVVDDAKDNRVLLHHFMKKTGANIEFAYDGKQAIDQIEKAIAADSPFNLILMDMQMPVLDGYSATKQLRQAGINTPIIAITAHALDGDREHCLGAGCNEYITKPVSRSTLIETCTTVINQHQPQQQPPAAA